MASACSALEFLGVIFFVSLLTGRTISNKKLWSICFVFKVKSQLKFIQNMWILVIFSTGKSGTIGIYLFIYLFLLYHLGSLHIISFLCSGNPMSHWGYYWKEDLWDSYVMINLLLRSLVPRPVFTNVETSSIKLHEEENGC